MQSVLNVCLNYSQLSCDEEIIKFFILKIFVTGKENWDVFAHPRIDYNTDREKKGFISKSILDQTKEGFV